MLDLNEEVMKGDNPNTDALTRAFSIQDEITSSEREITTAEKEMREVQRALDQMRR